MQGSGEYRELWDAFEQAQAECVLINLDTIIKAVKTDGDWRAAAWLLPRLRPEEYGDKIQQKTEHSGEIKITYNAEHKP